MRVAVWIVVLLALAVCNSPADGQEVLKVSDTVVTPSSARPGETILITCRVVHAKGPPFIKQVAASASQGNWNASYPTLYDDGTHGDKTAGDGVFSLAIPAAPLEGEEKIKFIAVDKDNVEVETKPISLIVKK